jgi:hypothetical protein
MLFKSVHEYEPAEVDDGAEAEAPEAAAAPVLSAARQRLSKLRRERSEAEAEAQRARDAIGRLQSAIAATGPIESQIANLDASEANLIAQWSTAGGTFPVLDADRRRELEESLADAKNRAAGAARAIPHDGSRRVRRWHQAAAARGAIFAASMTADIAARSVAKVPSLAPSASRALTCPSRTTMVPAASRPM